MHEKRAFEIRYKRSAWFRFLVDNFSVIGDKAYRGIEKVVISAQKEIKRVRQIIETSIGGTKGYYTFSILIWLCFGFFFAKGLECGPENLISHSRCIFYIIGGKKK